MGLKELAGEIKKNDLYSKVISLLPAITNRRLCFINCSVV
jgi:hypothetical protein